MAANISHTNIAKLLIIVSLATFGIPLQPQAAAAQTVPQRYMVQFSATASRASYDATLATLNAQVVEWIPELNVAVVMMDGDVMDRSRSARESGLLNFVEPDGLVTGDLLVAEPALTDEGMSYGYQVTQAPNAWTLLAETSRETIVAIVDSGINADHPEFAGRLVAGYDWVNRDDTPEDEHGHGTHVAGIVAAGINGVGHAGVCPTCKIMPVKVLNQNNQGTWSMVANGILFAKRNGAKVINLSLGAFSGSDVVRQAIEQAQAEGVIVVAAAGNNASSAPYYPAAYPGVIGVSATDNMDQLWGLSNRGDNIDLSAPGYRIYSTYNDLSTGGYAYMTGTSMAAPFVTGLAALVLAYSPTELTGDEVVALLQENADDKGDAGWDLLYGHGRINVCQTMSTTLGADAGACSDSDGDDEPGDTSSAIFLPVVTR